MYFDYFTAAALRDELNEALAGGRVQNIVEIDELSLGFEIYKPPSRRYLYMTASPENARVHLTEGKLRRGVTTPSPLGLLLKKYIDGGRIIAVRQPPWERILLFDFMTPDGEYSLVVEPIERRSNLILVESDVIRESVRRVGADENRVRQILPGHDYKPPPPQDKRSPHGLSEETLYTILDNDGLAAQALVRGIHGISPLLAREIVFDATGDVKAKARETSAAALLDSFNMIVEPLLDGDFTPGYVVENDEVMLYAVYPITHRFGWNKVDAVSQAMETYYGAISGPEAYEAAKDPIRKQLAKATKRLNGKLYSLKNQKRDAAEIERLKQSGELILAYQYQIEPQQKVLEAQYDFDAPPLKIKLDPEITALENAQNYFTKYEKAKRSVDAVPDLIERTQQELDYLSQLDSDLELAGNWPEIGEVQEALQQAGYWQGAKRRQLAGSPGGPMKVVADDGTIIWVGRNARQNEEVTFKKGTADDIWMHARGVPGSHVVVKTAGRPVPDEILVQAAAYAAYYSKARHAGSVEVIVTERKHIRKVKGGKPGMVQMFKQSHPSIRAVPQAIPED